jgi:hypothetical protein
MGDWLIRSPKKRFPTRRNIPFCDESSLNYLVYDFSRTWLSGTTSSACPRPVHLLPMAGFRMWISHHLVSLNGSLGHQGRILAKVSSVGKGDLPLMDDQRGFPQRSSPGNGAQGVDPRVRHRGATRESVWGHELRGRKDLRMDLRSHLIPHTATESIFSNVTNFLHRQQCSLI